jgi:hypothetical protein
VELGGLVGVYSYPAAPVAVVVYHARVLEGTITVCHENDRVEWVAPDAIPWADLAFPSTIAALRDFLAGR